MAHWRHIQYPATVEPFTEALTEAEPPLDGWLPSGVSAAIVVCCIAAIPAVASLGAIEGSLEAPVDTGEDSGWHPTFDANPVPRHGLEVQLQPTGSVGPVLVPSPAEAAASYQGNLVRLAPFQPPPAFFFDPNPVEGVFDAATFPWSQHIDLVRRAPFQAPSTFFDPAPIVFDAAELAWLPAQVEVIQPLPRQHAAFFFDPQPPAFAPETFPWPQAVDVVRPLPTQHTSVFFEAEPSDTPSTAEALGWRPEAPDDLVRPVELRYAYPSVFYVGEPADVEPDAEEAGWLPTYPDFARGQALHPSAEPWLFFHPEPFPESPELAWSPVYPDAIDRRRTLPSDPAVFFDPKPIPTVDLDPDKHPGPVYPAAIDRLRTPPSTPSFFFAPQPVPTVPALAWSPVYPSKIDRLEFLADRQQAFAGPNLVIVFEPATYPKAYYPAYINREEMHASRIPSFFSEELPIPEPDRPLKPPVTEHECPPKIIPSSPSAIYET
jgi:hypothetical protein